jgi:hypothetical protein
MALNGEVSLQSPLVFNGWSGNTPSASNPDPNSLNAKDWLRELKARKATGTWTDARTFTIIQSSFRGSASDWWETQEVYLTRVEFTAFSTVFETFETAFKRTFGLSRTDTDQANWADLNKQRPAESVARYAARLGAGLFAHYKHALSSTIDDYADIVLPADGLAAIARLRAIEAATPDIELILLQWETRTTQVVARSKIDHAKRLVDSNLRSTLITGLRSAALRTLAHEINRNETRTDHFIHALSTEETRLSLDRPTPTANGSNGNGNGNGNGKKNFKKVHELDIDDEESEETEVCLEALQKKSKKQTTNGKPKTCSWCQNKGHTESVCNKKKAGLPKRDYTFKGRQASALVDQQQDIVTALGTLSTANMSENSKREW